MTDSKQGDQLEVETRRELAEKDVRELVGYLIRSLGLVTTAMAAGLTSEDTKTVGSWTEGVTPSREQESRLRLLYLVMRLAEKTEGIDLARAIVLGEDPYLGDRSVIDFLAKEPLSATNERLLLGAVRNLQ